MNNAAFLRQPTGLIVALCSILVSAAGCGGRGSQGEGSDHTSGSVQLRSDSLRSLTAKLGQLPGTYSIGAHGEWVFSGDRKLFEAIAQFGDSAVVQLVNCLDDTTASTATVEGRRVPLGVVCHEALIYTAYAEPQGSESGDWPGTVMPTTASESLQAAKSAWLLVVQQHSYRLN